MRRVVLVAFAFSPWVAIIVLLIWVGVSSLVQSGTGQKPSPTQVQVVAAAPTVTTPLSTATSVSIPSNTVVPLTFTLEPSPLPTETPQPSATLQPTETQIPTQNPTKTPQPTETQRPTETPQPSATAQPVIGFINGDFEQGDTGWKREEAFVSDSSGKAHSGTHYVQMGGEGFKAESIRQIVSVPTDKPFLTFWHTTFSLEPECYSDSASILVDPNPNDIEPGDFVLNIYDFCKGGDDTSWHKQSVDLRAYAGQKVQISFRLGLEIGYSSYWHLDDISFEAGP